MSTAYQAKRIKTGDSKRAMSQADTVSDIGTFDLATANGGGGALVLNDTIDTSILPGNHIPTDLILFSDDLDSGTAIMLQVGLYDPVLGTTNVACFLSASNVAQAGGIARANVVDFLKLAPVDYDRYVRITVSTAPGTGAATGKVGTVLRYVANDARYS